MCIIVDVNRLGEMLSPDALPVAAQIRNWVESEGRILVGGKLLREYRKVSIAGKWIAELLRSGRAILEKDEVILKETRAIQDIGEAISNDIHILALARAKNSRVVYTSDQNLATDFKNKALINGPAGRVIMQPRKSKKGGTLSKLTPAAVQRILSASDCPA